MTTDADLKLNLNLVSSNCVLLHHLGATNRFSSSIDVGGIDRLQKRLKRKGGLSLLLNKKIKNIKYFLVKNGTKKYFMLITSMDYSMKTFEMVLNYANYLRKGNGSVDKSFCNTCGARNTPGCIKNLIDFK